VGEVFEKAGPLEDQTGGRPTTGDLIRMARERQKMSARALSAKANLSPSYVGKVESGEIEPSLKAFARIALALHLSRQEIWLCVVESVR
jgi:transcriptional regulator with XRE-family HTH domain